MLRDQTVSILKWIRPSKSSKKTGKAPILIRITIAGQSSEISTGQYILPQFWDTGAKLCLPVEDFKEINDQLDEIVKDLEAHFRVLKKKYNPVTVEMLKNVYMGMPEISAAIDEVTGKEINKHSILDAANLKVDEFQAKVKAKKGSEFTLRHWRATRNKLREFLFYKYKAKDTLLSDIKIKTFAREFHSYLTTKRESFLSSPGIRRAIESLHYLPGEPGNIAFNRDIIVNLDNATAHKQVKNTKHIFDLAVEQSWLEKNPFTKFNCDRGEKEVLPLELPEIFAIISKGIELQRLDEVRDCYVAQIFTGYACQDLAGLGIDNIIEVGQTRETWLSKQRGKTDVGEMVPVLPVVSRLIEKYKNHPCRTVYGRLFPVLSNQNYNAYLKEVAVLCNVKRELRTHLARHTFADVMLNECGIPLEDVSKMLGHKSIRTTMRYCRVRKQRISENMAKATVILFGQTGLFSNVA